MDEQAKPLTVRILRCEPGEDAEPYWQTYCVPRHRATRVLDALEYIQDEIDPSLGYRRHICHNLVCRSCMVDVDGHARLTCQTVVRSKITEVTVTPLADFECIRDLIVDFARPKKS